MEKNNETPAKDMLPENFGSIEAFWDFWDTHSSADYEEFTESVEAEIRLPSQKVYCAIAKDLFTQVKTEARLQGVSSETLINLWVKEKVSG